MTDILANICEKKNEELKELKTRCSFSSLEKLLKHSKNRGFKDLLIKSHNKKKNNIIAEIKKSSPSAGEIISDYKPEVIATDYEKGGVGAISILTEKNFFNGNIDHLSIINRNTKLPILRKDFIIDKYQILESKIYNADAILLIAAILEDDEIKEFIKIAYEYGLDCLIEIHTQDELERALKIGYPIIGINNRNLKNLKVDINRTFEIIKNVPKEFTLIAESGIKNREDINKFNNYGIYNFLIGESILKSKDISQKINELIK
tara:strand:+ start:435 stop:1220 length:786 start_codon:yes stop_codon:yes gene_type:complete